MVSQIITAPHLDTQTRGWETDATAVVCTSVDDYVAQSFPSEVFHKGQLRAATVSYCFTPFTLFSVTVGFWKARPHCIVLWTQSTGDTLRLCFKDRRERLLLQQKFPGLHTKRKPYWSAENFQKISWKDQNQKYEYFSSETIGSYSWETYW